MRTVVFLLLFFPCMAVANQPFVRDFIINESNNPVKVNAIVQDKTGYIWLGTDAGVYRFNGRNFIAIADNIKKPVTALAIGNNKVYAGYATGDLVEIKNNTAYNIHVYNYAPQTVIHDISVNGDVLSVSTEEGVFIIMNNVGILLNSTKGLSDNFTYSISVPGTNMALIGTDKGINILQPVKDSIAVSIISSGNYSCITDNIISVIKQVQHKNTFWIGTQNGGILKLAISDSGYISFVHNPHTWKWGQVNDIISISENKAWVATESGYLLQVFLTKDSVTISPYTIGKSIKKILLDKAGNIWCATSGGITMVASSYLSYINMPEAFSVSKVTAMTIDNKNKLWYTQDHALYKISLSDSVAQPHRMYSAATPITSLFADPAGGLWVGTFGGGLWYLDEHKTIPVKDIADLNKANILSITGNKERIWIASLNGVTETKKTGIGKLQLIKHHNKQSGVGSDYVYQLYMDKLGRTWLATDGAGICMYDGLTYHHWDSANGITSKVIYSITQDADSNMWIGTLDKGTFFYDGTRFWHSSMKADESQQVNISAIASNKTGQVVEVQQKEINEWFPASHEFRHYNKRYLPQIDSVSTVLNCIATDTERNVYTPFNDGFIVFNNLDSNFFIKPTVHINSLSVFLKPIPALLNHLSYNQNYITINFDGINYISPEQLHYRYLLQGYNNKWVYTDDESVTFPELPPGQYRFHIQVSLGKSFYRAAGDTYTFVIATPFWKEKWFYIFVLLVIVTLIYLYTRWREQQLTKMAHLQEERMLYEYEHLKSQVNPHFLFNSLNTLANLIEEDKDAAIDYTTQLSDLYRHMLSYRNRDLVLLSEEWEILTGYMYIQQSRFGNALRMETDIPIELLQTKKIVPLSLQIVVENAIKHNIVSASMPLVIFITATDELVIISNHLQPKMSKEKSSGLGLANISKRYALLSKKEVSFGIVNNEFIVKLPLL